MALNSNLTYSIHVDTANATATVRDLNGQIVKTKVPISDLNKEFGSLTATIANNSQMASGNIVIHKNSEVALQNEIRVLNTLKSSLDVSSDKYVEMGNKVALLEQKLKTLRTGGVSASGGLEQMKTASGGATSAVLELGRVVQDAPYGIRGMANNITQLVSQMAFATKSAGGFGAALKQVWAAMLGPFGIVLAISAVISVLDGMYGGMKKAEKANDDYLSGIEDLVGVQSDLNDKIEEYLVLQKIKQDLDTNKEKSNKRLKELDEEILEVEKRKGIANSLRIANEEAYANSLDKTTVRAKGYYKGISKYSKEVNELTTKENELNKERLDITNTYLKQLEDYRNKKKSLTRAEKGTVNWYKEEIKKESELRDSLSTTSEEYAERTKKIDELNKKLRELKNGRDKAIAYILDVFPSIDKDKFAKMTDSELLDLKRYLEIVSKKKPLKMITELDLSFFESEKNKKETDKKLKKIFDDKIKQFQEYADIAKSVLGSVTSFLESEYERELTIEQNRTNELNNELNQRLLNENLSKEERAKIQNEIAKNDEALRKKQEAIEKKRFEMNKVANIAGATIDTFRAAAGVLADTKGGSFARIAGMIAVIGAGLAQVTAISRQQFQTSAGSNTPIRGLGSSGSGQGDRSFNYNLVGNTQANQIAEAIQNQFSSPLKAYVVSRDVTTQQELDMNIKAGASF